MTDGSTHERRQSGKAAIRKRRIQEWRGRIEEKRQPARKVAIRKSSNQEKRQSGKAAKKDSSQDDQAAGFVTLARVAARAMDVAEAKFAILRRSQEGVLLWSFQEW